jgi:hypothetical protein
VSVHVTRLALPLELTVVTAVLEVGTAIQGALSSWRQSWPVTVPADNGSLSVEREGAVKWSSTVLPVRVRERSRTGSGSLSEGARGGPGLAQPAAIRVIRSDKQPQEAVLSNRLMGWDECMG